MASGVARAQLVPPRETLVVTRSQGVSVRRASVSDAAIVAPFHLQCWHEAYAGLVPLDFLDHLDRQDRVQRWRDRLSRNGDTTLLAFDHDAVVGLATVGASGDAAPFPPTEVRSLYVARSHQRKGLGRGLLDAALDDTPASLWVFEDNAGARGFYANLGWRPNGERRNDPGTRIPEIRLVRGVSRVDRCG